MTLRNATLMTMNLRTAVSYLALVVLAACTVSDDQEVAMGQQDAAQVNAQLPLVTDPEITSYVDRIGQSIAAKTSRSDLAWHFYVVNTNDVNAFALPGGFIYVNRGLIEQSDKLDELAGTLGHEIGHVVRRHAVEQLKKQTGANIGLSLACTLTRLCEHAASQIVINAAGSALFARYSRVDEAQADSEAVVNVVRAGYDPRGIPELFKVLLRERKRSPTQLDAFFASHPLEESRITATEEQIRQLGPGTLQGLLADDPGFHAFRNALASLPAPPPPPSVRQLP
jgi:beta-barrel assembly-enhancing protease